MGAYRNLPTLFPMAPSASPIRHPLPQDWGSHHTQNSTRYYLRNGKSYELRILHAQKVVVGVVILPEIFRAPTHRAHRAVIFAIAQLSC